MHVVDVSPEARAAIERAIVVNLVAAGNRSGTARNPGIVIPAHLATKANFSLSGSSLTRVELRVWCRGVHDATIDHRQYRLCERGDKRTAVIGRPSHYLSVFARNGRNGQLRHMLLAVPRQSQLRE